jgi:SAM-dependent methyltransferase
VFCDTLGLAGVYAVEMGRAEEPLDQLLGEQVAYFDARAPEYDASMEPDPSDPDFEEWQELRAKLCQTSFTGDVVDLAAGSGRLTELVQATADSVTLVDAADDMLELARGRLGDDGITYVVADLFDWKPDRQYDIVFSSFWLCHVPPDLVPDFVDLVTSASRAGGSVVLVDEHAYDDPGLAAAAAGQEDPWVSHRTVQDGRKYRVVKVSHDPTHIAGLFHRQRWQTTINHHGDHFYMLTATRQTS